MRLLSGYDVHIEGNTSLISNDNGGAVMWRKVTVKSESGLKTRQEK